MTLSAKSEPHALALAEVLRVDWKQGGMMPREARRLVLLLLAENPAVATTVPLLRAALQLDSEATGRLRRIVRDLYGSGYLRRRRHGRSAVYIYKVTSSGCEHMRKLERLLVMSSLSVGRGLKSHTTAVAPGECCPDAKSRAAPLDQ